MADNESAEKLAEILQRRRGEKQLEHEQSQTDFVLERQLILDIENQKKYDEIWTRIELYKRNRGHYSLIYDKLWETVGKQRRRFCSERGTPIREYEGNREFGLKLLMMTYDKLPHVMDFPPV